MFGHWAVLLTCCLLKPLTLPVSLLAGSTRYPLSRFLLSVVLGELTWVQLFGGWSCVFAHRWERISDWPKIRLVCCWALPWWRWALGAFAG